MRTARIVRHRRGLDGSNQRHRGRLPRGVQVDNSTRRAAAGGCAASARRLERATQSLLEDGAKGATATARERNPSVTACPHVGDSGSRPRRAPLLAGARSAPRPCLVCGASTRACSTGAAAAVCCRCGLVFAGPAPWIGRGRRAGTRLSTAVSATRRQRCSRPTTGAIPGVSGARPRDHPAASRDHRRGQLIDVGIGRGCSPSRGAGVPRPRPRSPRSRREATRSSGRGVVGTARPCPSPSPSTITLADVVEHTRDAPLPRTGGVAAASGARSSSPS
jgi:hypothetical protein